MIRYSYPDYQSSPRRLPTPPRLSFLHDGRPSNDHAVATRWTMMIRDVCLALTPTLLLSSPGRWRLIREEDEYKAAEADQQERVARNALTVLQWVEEGAPKELKRLAELLKDVEEPGLDTLCLVAVTCYRFISVRLPNNAKGYSINTWTEEERSLWTSPKTEALAKSILHSSSILTMTLSHGAVVLRAEIVEELLRGYLKPLFQATPSANIHQETGRRRKKSASGRSTFGAGMEEDILWKGGDILRAQSIHVLGVPLFEKDRHLGLGCENVLYACCRSIAGRAADERKDDVWAESWPLVLPPLLQLLEDPSPRFRLAGVRILGDTLLREYRDDFERRRIGSLLLRTGVAELLREALASSLTFLTSRLAGALLQSTAEAWIRLTFITTDDPATGTDGGRERYEQLSRLIDEGVLRVWAYAPTNVTSIELVEGSTSADERKPYDITSKQQEEEEECNSVIDSSIDILTRLASEEVMGIGMVRYLDVIMEFLTQQIVGVEAKLDRLTGKTRKGSLWREFRAARAIVAFLQATKECPTLQPWCARCLTFAARCWIVLAQLPEEWSAKSILQTTLLSMVKTLYEAQPQQTKELSRTIVELDAEVLAGLFESIRD